MKEIILEQSQRFWKALEAADTAGMRAVCDPDCFFVHIGANCGLDEEMAAFERKIFQPTVIAIHGQEVKEWGDTAICLTDVDYSLLLGGHETTHHFMTTEVFQKRDGAWKLIQFTFTALVH